MGFRVTGRDSGLWTIEWEDGRIEQVDDAGLDARRTPSPEERIVWLKATLQGAEMAVEGSADLPDADVRQAAAGLVAALTERGVVPRRQGR